MTQILHIFKKDLRRHWPEILISLALLALFVRQGLDLREPEPGAMAFGLFFQLRQWIAPFLVIFWAFMIVRVVQGESLVGDRQWWTTKPYVWWQLLLAKLLFILVVICVPLFHAQILLLHESGFAVLPYLWSIVLLQISLPVIIFSLAILLGCLTRNLRQAFVAVGLAIAGLMLVTWLMSKIPGARMQMFSELSQELSNAILFLSIALIPIWQFARRRTWASCGVLCAGFAVSAVFGVLHPNNSAIDKIYPLIDPKNAPLQVSFLSIPTVQESEASTEDRTTDPFLTIPIAVTGVGLNTFVLLRGVNIAADTPTNSRWSPGWSQTNVAVWPEDQYKTVFYQVARDEYEKIKSRFLNLRVALAFDEYQGADAHDLALTVSPFQDDQLGTCRLWSPFYGQFQCLKPIQTPGYMIRFDAPKSLCASQGHQEVNSTVANAWQPPHFESIPDPGLNPVANYNINFAPASLLEDLGREQSVPRSVSFCSGAEVRIARPVFKRQVRLELELPNVRLQDLKAFR